MFWWHLVKLRQIHSTQLHHTIWVVATAVVGQSYIALNRRTLAVIGCEKNHTNSHFFSRSGYRNDRMQVSVAWTSFSTAWYWVILVNTLKIWSTDTQPYPLTHTHSHVAGCRLSTGGSCLIIVSPPLQNNSSSLDLQMQTCSCLHPQAKQ